MEAETEMELKSASMAAFEHLAGRTRNHLGERFGRLVVRDWGGFDPRNGQSQWTCKCDCGNGTLVSGRSLRAGTTQSCCCLRSERLRHYNARLRAGKLVE
jgi:hypothetical protein